MAEQLRLKEVFRDGGAVHLDKRRLTAGAEQMDEVGDEFLARACLAADEYRPGGLGDASHDGEQFAHFRAVADDLQRQFLAAVNGFADGGDIFLHGHLLLDGLYFFQQLQ